MIKKLIADLTSGKTSVSTALKMSKAIFSIHEDNSLAEFIKLELEGYTWDNAPDYRTLVGTPKANYRKKFDGQFIVLPLNFSEINKEIGLNFNERKIVMSIVEIENLINKADGSNGEICIIFSQEQLRLLWENTNASNDNGWFLESAWWAFPTNLFQNIYSRTQDALIDRLIQINKNYPQLDQQLDFMTEKNETTKTIQTTIHGNVIGSNLGIGESISQKDTTINYNEDIKKIIDKIVALGFEKSDTKDLEEILIEKKKTGASVSKQLMTWIGKMASKAIEKGIEHKIPEMTDTISSYL